MIHYHGTPIGGTRQDAARVIAGRHVMIPFPRPDDLGCAIEFSASFCVDNGAYSIWKQGGTLDVEGYFSFVESVMRYPAFDFAIMPDVIDSDLKSNREMIGRWPFDVSLGAPVWHLHEPIEHLRFLCGAYPRVALGSSGEWSTPGTPEWWRRMHEAMHAICDADGRPFCKLHGLRMLNPEVFRRLPLASADSTNAARNGNLVSRFGMYAPATQGQRQQVIAERIEAHQSAARWKSFGATRQGLLFEDVEESLS